MRLFEALYGRKCNTVVSWDNPVDKAMIGLELLKEMEEENGKDHAEFESCTRSIEELCQ
jgi:hypothetical protein